MSASHSSSASDDSLLWEGAIGISCPPLQPTQAHRVHGIPWVDVAGGCIRRAGGGVLLSHLSCSSSSLPGVASSSSPHAAACAPSTPASSSSRWSMKDITHLTWSDCDSVECFLLVCVGQRKVLAWAVCGYGDGALAEQSTLCVWDADADVGAEAAEGAVAPPARSKSRHPQSTDPRHPPAPTGTLPNLSSMGSAPPSASTLLEDTTVPLLQTSGLGGSSCLLMEPSLLFKRDGDSWRTQETKVPPFPSPDLSPRGHGAGDENKRPDSRISTAGATAAGRGRGNGGDTRQEHRVSPIIHVLPNPKNPNLLAVVSTDHARIFTLPFPALCLGAADTLTGEPGASSQLRILHDYRVTKTPGKTDVFKHAAWTSAGSTLALCWRSREVCLWNYESDRLRHVSMECSPSSFFTVLGGCYEQDVVGISFEQPSIVAAREHSNWFDSTSGSLDLPSLTIRRAASPVTSARVALYSADGNELCHADVPGLLAPQLCAGLGGAVAVASPAAPIVHLYRIDRDKSALNLVHATILKLRDGERPLGVAVRRVESKVEIVAHINHVQADPCASLFLSAPSRPSCQRLRSIGTFLLPPDSYRKTSLPPTPPSAAAMDELRADLSRVMAHVTAGFQQMHAGMDKLREAMCERLGAVEQRLGRLEDVVQRNAGASRGLRILEMG